MENLNILTINLLIIVPLIIGTIFIIYSFGEGVNLKNIPKFILGSVLMFSVLITGNFKLKTNLNEYKISVVTNHLEIYSLNKSKKLIVDNSIVYEDYSKIVSVKCELLETYSKCLNKFIKKEIDVLAKQNSFLNNYVQINNSGN